MKAIGRELSALIIALELISFQNDHSSLDEELIRQYITGSRRNAKSESSEDASSAEQRVLNIQDGISSPQRTRERRISMEMEFGDREHLGCDLRRRTPSNASDIVTMTRKVAVASRCGGSSELQGIRHTPPPLPPPPHSTHSQGMSVQLQAQLNQKCNKALEYIPNANSYILNMNRSHSLDSDEPHNVAGRSDSKMETSSLNLPCRNSDSCDRILSFSSVAQPPLPPATMTLEKSLTYQLLSRTSAGCALDNHCYYLNNNRRSSEIWESNVHTCGRDRNQNARRFSNPRFYGMNGSDESNGNVVTHLGASNNVPVSCTNTHTATNMITTVKTSTGFMPSDVTITINAAPSPLTKDIDVVLEALGPSQICNDRNSMTSRRSVDNLQSDSLF